MSIEDYKKLINSIPQLIETEKKLFEVLYLVYVAESNLSDNERKVFSQRLVQTIIGKYAETKDDKYAKLLIKIQLEIGDKHNGSILYHFVPRNQKDIKVLMSIPEIRMMIRDNQEENLSLPRCERLPSFNMPINLCDKNYKKCYDSDRQWNFDNIK